MNKREQKITSNKFRLLRTSDIGTARYSLQNTHGLKKMSKQHETIKHDWVYIEKNQVEKNFKKLKIQLLKVKEKMDKLEKIRQN